jgi:hypothetical protein
VKVIRDRPKSVELGEFLARPLFAHLATASREGPRDSPVRFLARYLGATTADWHPRFRDTLGDPDNLFVRFVPETVVARDQSYGGGTALGASP